MITQENVLIPNGILALQHLDLSKFATGASFDIRSELFSPFQNTKKMYICSGYG